MSGFKGFPEGKVRLVRIPAQFFTELLPAFEHIGELKATLYIFYRLDQMEGVFRGLQWSEIIKDHVFLASWDEDLEKAKSILKESLQMAVKRGTLLSAQLYEDQKSEQIFLLNSPKGRAAQRAIESGKWRPHGTDEAPSYTFEPPNIFHLYEDNIGMITLMIAEMLQDAEQTYPLSWIEEAFRIAVENNKRSWRYIQTILERWQREGKHGRKEKPEDRSNTEQASRRYVEGEFSDFIEH